MELTSTEFLASFLSAISLYFPESGNPDYQPRNTPQTDLLPEYDFIIVGAGTAGCVVANRLTENQKWEVLLVEAGGEEDSITETPFILFYLADTEKDFNYTTTKQTRICQSLNGICPVSRGRVMGGSSTINGMAYARGNKADYDEWAAAGNTGWSYEDVLPYFIKSENNTEPSLQNSSYHGYQGYLNVQYALYKTPLAAKYIQAGIEFGWEEGDYNGEKQEVISTVQTTIDGPSRESTSKAYLYPIRDRPNLSVVKHAFVSKLLIDGNAVKGVEYYRNDRKYTVLAKKEVRVSAGAIDTPKLLMLSGIGPKEELAKHNIPLKADLPVGEHLQDHALFPMYFEFEENLTINSHTWKTNESIMEYAINRQGPLTTPGSNSIIFLNAFNKTQLPNLQVEFFSTATPPFFVPPNVSIATVVVLCIYPFSTGTVKLKSGNWKDAPLIDPNYFYEDVDFEVVTHGANLVLDYMKTPTMASLKPKLYTNAYNRCPYPLNKKMTDEYIKCLIMNYAGNGYHFASTARMGAMNFSGTVVTPDLKVKGFHNLRVIDASIMPYLVRGNTNAPIVMIGEKGADIIIENYAI